MAQGLYGMAGKGPGDGGSVARHSAETEVFAGQKSFNNLGTWLPNETVEAFRTYLVGIKGPLTTPVGSGIRSLQLRTGS